MTKLNADDFSPIDLEDDLVREAILETQGREYTDEEICLLYTSPSPRDLSTSRMPSSA